MCGKLRTECTVQERAAEGVAQGKKTSDLMGRWHPLGSQYCLGGDMFCFKKKKEKRNIVS